MHIRAVGSLVVLQLPAAATVFRKALAERNSGVRKVSYGGHGARSPRTSSEGRAVPSILTVGTVPVAALLIRAH